MVTEKKLPGRLPENYRESALHFQSHPAGESPGNQNSRKYVAFARVCQAALASSEKDGSDTGAGRLRNISGCSSPACKPNIAALMMAMIFSSAWRLMRSRDGGCLNCIRL